MNQQDTLAVFKAVSVEDFGDVASLLPPNTALPAADRMTYLLARLEVRPGHSDEHSMRLQIHGSTTRGGVLRYVISCSCSWRLWHMSVKCASMVA